VALFFRNSAQMRVCGSGIVSLAEMKLNFQSLLECVCGLIEAALLRRNHS
jgi:hypothetical protein